VKSSNGLERSGSTLVASQQPLRPGTETNFGPGYARERPEKWIGWRAVKKSDAIRSKF
jgi:hypothetical protein